MKIFRTLCLIGWASLVSLSLQAQKKVSYSFNYSSEAGEASKLKELAQVSYSGTSSIRLYFEEVQLGTKSYLLLEGSDGAEQKMDATALKNWSNSSAYFNGQSVKISAYQAEGEAIVVKLKEIKVNEQGANRKMVPIHHTSAAQARTTDDDDDNLGYWSEAVGRFTDGVGARGTGWIAANGAIVTDNNFGALESTSYTDGNHLERYDIIEFNVPPSNPDGTVNHPAPEDQYPLNIDNFYWRRKQGTTTVDGIDWIKFLRVRKYPQPIDPIDNDLSEEAYNTNIWNYWVGGYTILEALPNSTGKRPGERIGKYFQPRADFLMEPEELGTETEMDLFHYAAHNQTGATSQTLQKTKIILNDNSLDWMSMYDGLLDNPNAHHFLLYDTPNPSPDFWDEHMEGGVIVHPYSNVAVGIHNEGDASGEGPSLSTTFWDHEFAHDLDEFFTTAVTHVAQLDPGVDYPYIETDGRVHQPYLTVAAGVEQANDHDILSITSGDYYEKIKIDKPLTLSAPVGMVVIGRSPVPRGRVTRPTTPADLKDDPSTAFTEKEDRLVERTSLKSFPNPFTHQTELHYTLTDDSPVVVKVYDMLGQEVQTLVEEEQLKGAHHLQWDGHTHLGKMTPTGLYIIQLNTGGETSTVRVIKQ
ncbi:MAG: T9SS type A sorting domain-containing protein [Bacteroidota bacterium]